MASYSQETATVTYDPELISESEIKELIRKLGYQPQGSTITNNSVNGVQIAGIFIIILALYVVLSRFGALEIFNYFPEAKEGMGFGMLFVIGLLTSTHCVAMCGGINLSQCVPSATTTGNRNRLPDNSSGLRGNSGYISSREATGVAFRSRIASLRPSFLYNTGRVISYTVIGGIVGALGQVVTLSGAGKGFIAAIAGLFMIIMGLNMLNLFPWLRRFNPRMPKVFAEKINEQKRSSSRPLYVGLLNGLMPCGPLQAMQLYALSTGDPVKGALSMLLFSLGTVPLMFGLGALSTVLTKKFTQKMMTVSAALVVILGVFMLGNGMALSGFAMPSFASGTTKGADTQIARAELMGDVQVVTTQLSSSGYPPIAVQAGIPVQWNLQAEEGDVSGCNSRIIIPEYNMQIQLQPGDNIIEFTPTESGTISFSCWMGMIRSQIVVVDQIDEQIDEQISEAGVLPSYQPSCCQ